MATATLKKKQAPPFPKERHWLFGSGYLLRKDAIGQVKTFIQKYGDILSLSLPLNKVVIAANPEYAKYVLLDNNKNYTKSLAYDMLKLLLGNGILTSEGDFWKKQRRLIQPAFHKQKLAELTAMMVQRTEEEADSFEPYAQSGEYVDVVTTMTALTLDIISKSIFSEGIGDNAPIIAKQITLLNQYATDKLNEPIRLPPAFPTPYNLRERKAIKILDTVIYDIINARRAAGESKADLLSMLLDACDEETGESMDNKQLRDEVMTIFVAGNETTANAMAWILYLLSQNPEAERKMIAEIDEKLNSGVQPGFDTMMQFSYVKQVIEEGMRLYPPAWVVGRRNAEDDELGGYHIAKGTNILIPILYLHRSVNYWGADAMEFKPERFAPEKRNSIDRFVYFPFGAGPRMCIGNNFAMLEMQIILISLYRRFTFRLKPDFPVETDALITLRPKHGLLMQVVRR
jgi:cytochrome P450